jgi:hypothetical protein
VTGEKIAPFDGEGPTGNSRPIPRKTIFKDEGLSGAAAKRLASLRCLKTLQPGDTLTVWKLDRLGRSLRELITILAKIVHAQSATGVRDDILLRFRGDSILFGSTGLRQRFPRL